MQTYIKLAFGMFCLVYIFLGTTQAQAVSRTDKNFNNDAYRIQKMLATDPAIYPEGKLTGVLDAPTEAALKRLSDLYNKALGFASGVKAPTPQESIDATIKAIISPVRASAEIYYDQNANSYKGFCKSTHFNTIKNDLKKYKSTASCSDAATSYQANVNLTGSKNYYCADSTGLATIMSKKPKKGSLACE